MIKLAKLSREDFDWVIDGTDLEPASIRFLILVFVERMPVKEAGEMLGFSKSRPYQLARYFNDLLESKLETYGKTAVIKLVKAQ